MNPLPTTDLRSTRATWAIADTDLPCIAGQMLAQLPREKFDQDFIGQALETTYFDTRKFKLRKARVNGDKYLTLRVRKYSKPSPPGSPPSILEPAYAISAKTESGKYRQEIDKDTAECLLCQNSMSVGDIAPHLPPDLTARLIELIGDERIQPVVTISFRRFAVEDGVNRLTLDTAIETDTGKCYPCNVLEYKSTQGMGVTVTGFRPLKLSKFLWATG